jgi:hypothetical protein
VGGVDHGVKMWSTSNSVQLSCWLNLGFDKTSNSVQLSCWLNLGFDNKSFFYFLCKGFMLGFILPINLLFLGAKTPLGIASVSK